MSSYIVNKTNGTTFVVIPEGAADFSSGLALLGQNFPNYGKLIAENFLHLLENQANTEQPTNPITGQLWWDSSTRKLKFFNGERFKSCASEAVDQYRPISPSIGDLWWDTVAKQLKIYDDSGWLVIGPTVAETITAPTTVSTTPAGAVTFIADAAYPYGTVLTLGGAKEVTLSMSRLLQGVVGVVHEYPIYTTITGDSVVTVMVAGKTRCRVTGSVAKGDMLVSSDTAGIAMAIPWNTSAPRGSVIGMSLENKPGTEVGSISVLVGRF